MVADRPRQARWPRTERRESIVERRAVADFAVSARHSGAARGEAGVDFGAHRTASPRRVARPERAAPPQPAAQPPPRLAPLSAPRPHRHGVHATPPHPRPPLPGVPTT